MMIKIERLVLQRFIGESVIVDRVRIVVTGMTSRSVTLEIDGRIETYGDNRIVQVTPDCRVSFYQIRKTNRNGQYSWVVKLVFEAPRVLTVAI